VAPAGRGITPSNQVIRQRDGSSCIVSIAKHPGGDRWEGVWVDVPWWFVLFPCSRHLHSRCAPLGPATPGLCMVAVRPQPGYLAQPLREPDVVDSGSRRDVAECRTAARSGQRKEKTSLALRAALRICLRCCGRSLMLSLHGLPRPVSQGEDLGNLEQFTSRGRGGANCSVTRGQEATSLRRGVTTQHWGHQATGIGPPLIRAQISLPSLLWLWTSYLGAQQGAPILSSSSKGATRSGFPETPPRIDCFL
jgi:hypothetical protein